MQTYSLYGLSGYQPEAFEATVRKKLDRALGREFFYTFDYSVDFIERTAGTFYIGTNRRELPGSPPEKQKAALYAHYFMEDRSVLLVEFDAEIVDMYIVPENRWILIVTEDRKLTLFDYEKQKKIWKTRVRTQDLFQVVVNEFVSQIFISINHVIYSLKKKNDQVKCQVIAELNRSIIKFDFLIERESMVVLTFAGVIMVYDYNAKTIRKAKEVEGGVVDFVIAERYNKISFSFEDRVEVYSLSMPPKGELDARRKSRAGAVQEKPKQGFRPNFLKPNYFKRLIRNFSKVQNLSLETAERLHEAKFRIDMDDSQEVR